MTDNQQAETMERQWRVLEYNLNSVMPDVGYSKREIDHVFTVLKPLWMAYAKPKDINQHDPDEQVKAVNQWVSNIANGFLMETAIREVELYRMKRTWTALWGALALGVVLVALLRW